MPAAFERISPQCESEEPCVTVVTDVSRLFSVSWPEVSGASAVLSTVCDSASANGMLACSGDASRSDACTGALVAETLNSVTNIENAINIANVLLPCPKKITVSDFIPKPLTP
jgi:hypothetical protein